MTAIMLVIHCCCSTGSRGRETTDDADDAVVVWLFKKEGKKTATCGKTSSCPVLIPLPPLQLLNFLSVIDSADLTSCIIYLSIIFPSPIFPILIDSPPFSHPFHFHPFPFLHSVPRSSAMQCFITLILESTQRLLSNEDVEKNLPHIARVRACLA